MKAISWDRYPQLSQSTHGKTWLTIQANLGLSPLTIDAYGRCLEDYLVFSHTRNASVETANKEHIALYVHDLTSRQNPRGKNIRVLDSGAGLANATLQQRLTAVRLFYDYLMEEGLRQDNPVGRGRYTPGKGFAGHRDRGLIPRYHKLPWIPAEQQWQDILQTVRQESLRNRFMFALAYDAALRREELCCLQTGDLDPAHRLVHIRAETTKGRATERVIPYSEPTNRLYMAYLDQRRALSRQRGPLFLSESRRNKGTPLSIWTWSKTIEGIAERSGVLQFTTHTLRHLCLTDLARSGWDIHEIATFAGHRNLQTTMLYVHISGRELAEKFERGMASIHTWRTTYLAEVLQ